MLSKALLEWPSQASAQPRSNGEVARVIAQKPDPLDSEAWVPGESDTFEARWQARVENH